MKSDLQKHKTSDAIKWIATLIAFILAFTLIIGIICGWFNKKDKPTDAPTQTEASAVFSVEPRSTKAMKMSARLYSANSDGSYTVTATVQPQTAKNKAVDWAVAFNENSGWAVGKAASNYVTVTSIGESSAKITCKQAFGAKIKVIATSKDNPSVTASCMCDYYERVESVSGNFTGVDSFDTSKPVNTWRYTSGGAISQGDYNYGGDNQLTEICLNFSANKTAYTIAESLSALTVTLEATDEYKAKMKAISSDYTFSPVTFTANNGSVSNGVPENYGTGCYFPLMGMDNLTSFFWGGDAMGAYMMTQDCVQVLSENPNMNFMKMTVSMQGNYSNFNATTYFKADSSTFPLSVNSLSLDTNTIKF